MPSAHVQVAPDSTGKDIDTVSLTSSEAGTPTVHRQNVVIGDPTTYANVAGVTANGLKVDMIAAGAPAPQTVTPTLSNVAASASSVTVIASNVNRKSLLIVNDSTANMYIALDGSTASTTNYSVFLAGSVSGVPYQWEMPPNWKITGTITAIWASATGNARITELA